MCGRYWIDADESGEMQELLSRLRQDENVKTEGEIFPGDHVPVLCKSRAGNVRPFAMEWGYRMPDGKRLINARSETAAEKPMFRDSMRLRRCLLPMSSYFEWEKLDGEKRRRRIAPQEEGMHYLAGLYRYKQDLPVCTVLTTAAADEISFIHHRMTVILNSRDAERWLSGEEIDFRARLSMKYE